MQPLLYHQLMKNCIPFILPALLLYLAAACSTPKQSVPGQAASFTPASQELYNTIARMDSVLFDAFNKQDPDKLKEMFSEDLEFYHDKDGITDYAQTIENFRALFERNRDTGLRRDLVKGSLEVYPIPGFGAVEICLHRFCHQENGKDDCGIFKNIMLWQQKDGKWKVTRVISYDH